MAEDTIIIDPEDIEIVDASDYREPFRSVIFSSNKISLHRAPNPGCSKTFLKEKIHTRLFICFRKLVATVTKLICKNEFVLS